MNMETISTLSLNIRLENGKTTNLRKWPIEDIEKLLRTMEDEKATFSAAIAQMKAEHFSTGKYADPLLFSSMVSAQKALNKNCERIRPYLKQRKRELAKNGSSANDNRLMSRDAKNVILLSLVAEYFREENPELFLECMARARADIADALDSLAGE